MSSKRKSGKADMNLERIKFQKRGDLAIFNLATQSDCALMVGNERLLLHKAILISRSGFFRDFLTKNEENPVDHRGRVVFSIQSHDMKSVRLVVEFMYGAGSVEIMEYQRRDQLIIQDCILLFSLGNDFEIPDMAAYATRHLGMYLSKKLKDVCRYPVSKARQAVAARTLVEDLQAGFTQVYQGQHEPGENNNHPRLMLMDFVLAAKEVLFRDATFRLSIDQDVLPSAFLKDFILLQFGGKFQTPWMAELMVRPDKLNKGLEKKKPWKCEGCGEGVTKDQTVVFNPWSGLNLAHRYAQVCCEGCSREMDEGKGKGVEWGVFDDSKK